MQLSASSAHLYAVEPTLVLLRSTKVASEAADASAEHSNAHDLLRPPFTWHHTTRRLLRDRDAMCQLRRSI